MEKELSVKEAHTNQQHPACSHRWQFHYWTVLFKPIETEGILTLLRLDNNIQCCSIYL